MNEALAIARDAAQSAGLQLLCVFGGVFLLAVLLRQVSQRLRGLGSGCLGGFYYWLVAPGVVCHETGHALGCVLTFTKIAKFVPFHPKGNTLGYVEHAARRGVFGMLAEFVIATGPVWFGCAVIGLLSHFLAGRGFLPDPGAYAGGSGVSSVLDVPRCAWDVFRAAAEMLVCAATAWRHEPIWRVALYLYLVFCIASEVTLSAVDLKDLWKGLVVFVALVFALDCVPAVRALLNDGASALAPALFVCQAVMTFVLLVDSVFCAVVWLASLPIRALRK